LTEILLREADGDAVEADDVAQVVRVVADDAARAAVGKPVPACPKLNALS
jgi:hypothetical protein